MISLKNLYVAGIVIDKCARKFSSVSKKKSPIEELNLIIFFSKKKKRVQEGNNFGNDNQSSAGEPSTQHQTKSSNRDLTHFNVFNHHLSFG